MEREILPTQRVTVDRLEVLEIHEHLVERRGGMGVGLHGRVMG